MHSITLATLEAFPAQLENHFAAFPRDRVHWAPASWDGVPSEAVAKQRDYGAADAEKVLAQFRAARATTLQLLRGVTPEQMERRAEFEGYGPVSLRGLVHYLCSHDQQHLAGLQWLLGKVDAARSGA